jgi:hypothetical protein
MSTTNAQPAVGFIGPGEQGLLMATAIAAAATPCLCGPAIPAPSPTPPRRRRTGVRLRAPVVEVLEISLAEQKPRKSAARGTLNFSELRKGEVRHNPGPDGTGSLAGGHICWVICAVRLENSNRELDVRTEERTSKPSSRRRGRVQPLGLRTPEAVKERPLYFPGPPTDYTLLCASELNGRKPLVKDR